MFFFVFSSSIWSSDWVTWRRSVHRRIERPVERLVLALTTCSQIRWRRSTIFYLLQWEILYIKPTKSSDWMFRRTNEFSSIYEENWIMNRCELFSTTTLSAHSSWSALVQEKGKREQWYCIFSQSSRIYRNFVYLLRFYLTVLTIEDYRLTHAQRFRYIQIVIHIIPRKLSSGIEIQKFWYVFLELFRLLAEKNTLIRSKIIDILWKKARG